MSKTMYTFGPVPSRRLGRSLGVNNIPPKTCTYSCVYCQLGRTRRTSSTPRSFYDPGEILAEVHARVEAVRGLGESIDYLSFVPDGEPCLDLHLGEEIEGARLEGIKIAVISNASLLDRPEVRNALTKVDWISLKCDAAREKTWRRIDRPNGRLAFAAILEGIIAFSRSYHGVLVTETMLVKGLNDDPGEIGAIADFLAAVRPSTAYLSVPTRPPAEAWVRPPDPGSLNRAYQALNRRLPQVEQLIDYEGDEFACSGTVREDLLSIAAVHPLREGAVKAFLRKAGADWSVVDGLLEDGLLILTEYEGTRFFVRRFS